MIDSDERRSDVRVAWACQARLLPLNLEPGASASGMRQVMVCNLGEGGIQIRSSALFALGSTLLAELQIFEYSEGIQVVGSVVWISPNRVEPQCATAPCEAYAAYPWRLGIEFSDVGDHARSSIRNLIAQP